MIQSYWIPINGHFDDDDDYGYQRVLNETQYKHDDDDDDNDDDDNDDYDDDYDDDDNDNEDQSDDEVAGGGGGERPLNEKLNEGFEFEFKAPWGNTYKITGGFEIHRLALQDYEQLDKRSRELNEENINLTCDVSLKEVREPPLPNSSPKFDKE